MIGSPRDDKFTERVGEGVNSADSEVNVRYKPSSEHERIGEATKLVASDKVTREGEHWVVSSSNNEKKLRSDLDRQCRVLQLS